MKVALGGLQTSTDGLIYQPTKVRNIKKGRYIPSINGLSSGVHRHIKNKSLMGEKKTIYQWTSEELNLLALNHIKEFWNTYRLDFTYELEHDPKKFAKKMVYNRKAYQVYENLDGEIIYKGLKPDSLNAQALYNRLKGNPCNIEKERIIQKKVTLLEYVNNQKLIIGEDRIITERLNIEEEPTYNYLEDYLKYKKEKEQKQ